MSNKALSTNKKKKKEKSTVLVVPMKLEQLNLD